MRNRTGTMHWTAMSLAWPLAVALVAGLPAASAPPDAIHYQAVLRDQQGEPIDGTIDAIFSLYSAETAGEQILHDRHSQLDGNGIAVERGLFSVSIGSGVVEDGDGAGSFTSVTEAFRSYDSLWLEIQIADEVLSPRTEIVSAGFAMRAFDTDSLEGRTSAEFLVKTSPSQTIHGSLIVDYASAEYALDIEALKPIQTYSPTEGTVVRVGGDTSIYSVGSTQGAYFLNDYNSAVSLAEGSVGLFSGGNVKGGHFYTDVSNVWAELASGSYGIKAYGTQMGGRFEDTNGSGMAEVGFGGTGIVARGDNAGGYFVDNNSGTWTHASYSTSSTRGSGAKNFVQNHPEDPDKQVVYSAVEGDEVGTYTRGRGRLRDGEATIELGKSFRLVTNPVLGLTAHLTPRDLPIPLAVVSIDTERLVVRGPSGSDAAFDYLVQGLRIGFEDVPVIHEKPAGSESPIPNMNDNLEMVSRFPELGSSSARARFSAMLEEIDGASARSIDRSAELALIEKIGRFDPGNQGSHPAPTAQPVVPSESNVADPRIEPDRSIASVASELPPDSSTNSSPVRSPTSVALEFAPTADIVAGDLLTLDLDAPNRLRPSATPADPRVVGVALGMDRMTASGLVHLHVDAGYGDIRPGDLLVSSPTPGHAMRSIDPLQGTVVGKALEPLDSGKGRIAVLLMFR